MKNTELLDTRIGLSVQVQIRQDALPSEESIKKKSAPFSGGGVRSRLSGNFEYSMTRGNMLFNSKSKAEN